MIDDYLLLVSARQCVGPSSEAGVSGSVVTRVGADILLVRGMDREPGLLGALIRMRVVFVVGEVEDVGGEEARKMSCRGMAVSIGGEQRRHVLRLDDEISAYAERCSRELG